MVNNILHSNFSFLARQILYPITKFAPCKLEKAVFISIMVAVSMFEPKCKKVVKWC